MEIIYDITKEKFVQNDNMLERLMATNDLRLYEATPQIIGDVVCQWLN